MQTIDYDTVVVGSGCAGYNAIDWLSDLGMTDIALVTEGRLRGTSRNTGSDKQTYYKLSLSGSDCDSIAMMAHDLAASGDVDGPVALAEAASSVLCFMKLVLLGVGFPTDSYGQFVGYRTDHDPRQRATSAGPLTSRYMTEALERKVLAKGIPILDDHCVIQAVVEDNRLCALVAIHGDNPVLIHCNNVIWCTGGPAGIYRDTVYPESQRGMSGVLLQAGCKAAGLQYWQYGIASLSFRWNLSGTYQQVIPRYISIDEDGTEHEFLFEQNDYDGQEVLSRIFLKGYQWPFDSRKASGSSWIDLAVHHQKFVEKRKVFLDYRKNSRYMESDFSNIGDEARTYLGHSHALFGTPIQRLEAMNPLAVRLYREHGIDLETDLLEIGVCAQHHNGGILVDEMWRSSVKGIYVAGEAAGTFGAYRPGGTALNSTQVGSMRAAMAIAETGTRRKANLPSLQREAETVFIRLQLLHDRASGRSGLDISNHFRARMSEAASFLRDEVELKSLLAELEDAVTSYWDEVVLPPSVPPQTAYTVYDQLITSMAVVQAMIAGADAYGSDGGALVMGKEGNGKGAHASRLTTCWNGNTFSSRVEPTRPVPDRDTWFETVWADYRKRMATIRR